MLLSPVLEDRFPFPSHQHLQIQPFSMQVIGPYRDKCEKTLIQTLNTMHTKAISAGKHSGIGTSMNWLLIFTQYEHDGMIARTMWEINSLLHRPMVHGLKKTVIFASFLFFCTNLSCLVVWSTYALLLL